MSPNFASASCRADIVEDTRPTFYVPLDQRPDRVSATEPRVNGIALSVAGSVAPVIATLRAVIGDTGTVNRTRHVFSMSELLEPRYAPWEQAARLFAGFTVLALLLTVVGLYGVLNYLVSLRCRELGVRMALGAGRMLVMRMILCEGVAKLAHGVPLGVTVTYFASRALQPLLYHVSPRDPHVIAVAIAGLVAAGVLAALPPARRAMRLDPSDALRQE